MLKTSKMSVNEIREAKDELIRMSNNEDERMIYEMRAKAIRDEISALEKIIKL